MIQVVFFLLIITKVSIYIDFLNFIIIQIFTNNWANIYYLNIYYLSKPISNFHDYC